jgi:hypothetical protein
MPAPGPAAENGRVSSRRVLAGLSLAAVTLVAGCGGGGGGGGDDASDPNSASYDPATTTLKAAGLEVCSEQQRAATGGLEANQNGLAAARAFFVAKDCNGSKESPNVVAVFQFTSADAVQSGMVQIKKAYPRAKTVQRGPLIIAATGPNAAANLSAIEGALPTATTS